MDNIDYKEIMDVLVNDKQTYDALKRDPTPALHKLLILKKTEKIDFRRYS